MKILKIQDFETIKMLQRKPNMLDHPNQNNIISFYFAFIIYSMFFFIVVFSWKYDIKIYFINHII